MYVDIQMNCVPATLQRSATPREGLQLERALLGGYILSLADKQRDLEYFADVSGILLLNVHGQ